MSWLRGQYMTTKITMTISVRQSRTKSACLGRSSLQPPVSVYSIAASKSNPVYGIR